MGSGSGPVAPAVDSHQELVVWVGGAPGSPEPVASSGGSRSGAPAAVSVSPGTGSASAAPENRDRVARRARAWYSGPCLRGSAYSFGLSVQYVPLVVPYQLAPRQSGSKGPSTPS